MELDYEEAEESGPLGTVLKLLIMVVSLGVASLVGFYLHPHLLPLVMESIPQLWREAQSWMTAPILFLLLNVVVGTLYVSSNMLASSNKKAQEDEKGAPATVLQPAQVAAVADKQLSPDDRSGLASVASRPATTGLRARFEKSKTLTRLVRSKSEQIPPTSYMSEASGSAITGRLKKAGTFEASPRARKPVVVVADPPEDAPPGHEEVDKKAEDFISRFYQKVKLQRLDSLLRQQQQQGAASTN